MDVPGGQRLEVRDELGLGERGLEVELALEANAVRNLGEELLDRRDSDRPEHLLAVPVGQRKKTHCSARTLRYASASSSESTSEGSLSLIRTSHPSP